jgi:hypothetical protein
MPATRSLPSRFLIVEEEMDAVVGTDDPLSGV